MYYTKVILKNPSRRTGEGKLVIEITFKHQGVRERVYYPTQEKIHADHWKNGKISKANPKFKPIQRRVEEIHNEVKEIIYALEKTYGYVNATHFKNHINRVNNDEKDLITLFDEFIELKRLTAKAKMVIKLITIRNHLKNFLKRRKMYLVEYDQRFINSLAHYWQEKVGLQPNTIHKNFKFILLFLNQLRREEVLKTDKYKEMDYPREVETNTIVLEKAEVKRLIQYKPDNLRLSRVKDLFLVLIYTGLRFGDGIRISQRWVVNGMLHIHTQKTDEKITIPLHPNLKEVLEKYDYDLSSLAISNQKFNKYVKELCLEAGINADVEVVKYEKGIKKFHVIPKYTLIASHTGRRTFITNAILAGIPLSVIQRITGHKKLVTLQKYVEIADGIKVEEMEKLSKYFG